MSIDEFDYDLIQLLRNDYKCDNNMYAPLKEYYMNGIKNGNKMSIYNIGCCYQFIEEKYQKMKKYYLMAIKNGDSNAMNNLGCHYEKTKFNHKKMKKYYMMAIKYDNIRSMNNLATYYFKKKKYEDAKKYYLMASKKGNTMSMNNLGYYYQHIEKNYNEMIKYYLMGDECNHPKSRSNLIAFYNNNINDRHIINALSYAHKINDVNLKIKCINYIIDNQYRVINKYLMSDYYKAINISKIIIKYFGIYIGWSNILVFHENIRIFIKCNHVSNIKLCKNLRLLVITCLF